MPAFMTFIATAYIVSQLELTEKTLCHTEPLQELREVRNLYVAIFCLLRLGFLISFLASVLYMYSSEHLLLVLISLSHLQITKMSILLTMQEWVLTFSHVILISSFLITCGSKLEALIPHVTMLITAYSRVFLACRVVMECACRYALSGSYKLAELKIRVSVGHFVQPNLDLVGHCLELLGHLTKKTWVSN